MKIAISDSNALKFCQDIKKHWEDKGHEVRYEIGASEILSQWADLYYLDWSDNNVHYLMNIYNGNNPEHPNGPNYKKPIIAVRAIDIDIWMGHARDQALVNFVNKWICIAPHLEDKLRREAQYGENQLKLITPGVNVDKFTRKIKQTDGFQLGMALNDLWWYKNHMGGLDIFYSLVQQDPRWRLHIRGQHESQLREYNVFMYEQYLKSHGLEDKVILYDRVENMNEWYENIDILLHPGMKEGFCYSVGEALAKGIPVVVNHFAGAERIWKDLTINYKEKTEDFCFLYKSHKEAISFITQINEVIVDPNNYVSIMRDSCRNYIVENYSLEKMLNEYDKFLGT